MTDPIVAYCTARQAMREIRRMLPHVRFSRFYVSPHLEGRYTVTAWGIDYNTYLVIRNRRWKRYIAIYVNEDELPDDEEEYTI